MLFSNSQIYFTVNGKLIEFIGLIRIFMHLYFYRSVKEVNRKVFEYRKVF